MFDVSESKKGHRAAMALNVKLCGSLVGGTGFEPVTPAV
jgi:hypothetical protein